MAILRVADTLSEISTEMDLTVVSFKLAVNNYRHRLGNN